MIPATRDLIEYRGDTWKAWGYIMDDQQVPQPVDLQSATIRVQVRKYKGGDILLDITNGDGVTIHPDNQWEISALLDFRPGRHYWDFQVTDGGEVNTYYAGSFKLIDDVTRI